MWDGKEYHIECDIMIDGRFLIGTNEKGKTQTLEDVLNSLSTTVQFYNVEEQVMKLK